MRSAGGDCVARHVGRDAGAEYAFIRSSNNVDRVLIHSDRLLQRCLPEAVPPALTALRRASPFAVFTIATRFAVEIDADGANRHRCVRGPDWWTRQIETAFGAAHCLADTPKGVCTVLSWRPDAVSLRALETWQQRQRRAAVWRRRGERLRGRCWRVVKPVPDESRVLAELTGQRVALVGNAESLTQSACGPRIDAADIVIRCNLGIIVDRRSHGARTDWLCTALPLSKEQARRRGVTQIVWASRRKMMLRNIPSWMVASGRLAIFSKTRNEQLRAILGKVASTGMKALDLAACSECRSLDLFGFDFGRSNSASDPTRPMSLDHDFDKERAYALELIARDPRLTWYC